MEVVILLVITFAVFVVYKMFTKFKVNEISKNMMEATAKNDEQMFLAILNDRWTKWLVRPYYVQMSKIRFYTVNRNTKKLQELTDFVLNSKIRGREKVGLLNPMFSYFLENKDATYAKKIFDCLKDYFIEQENGRLLIEELEVLMDVYVNPKEKRIKDLEKYISRSSDDDKEVWQYRLATLYLNLNKKDKANEVLEDIRKHTKDMASYESFVAKIIK